MKRNIFVFSLLFLLISPVLNAQILNLSNMSVEWQRTGNRNAATDAADIVFYNPAGLTKLSDGMHINAGNQTLIRKPEHTADYTSWGDRKRTYEHDGVDWFLPNVYAAYKNNNWAVFAGFCIPAGGATVNYSDGSITTQMLQVQINNYAFNTYGATYDSFTNQSLEASSIYMMGLLGGSYAINEIFSVAAGVRYVHARNTTKGELYASSSTVPSLDSTFKIDTEDTADGFSGVIGLNIAALPELNIGIRYETVTKLNFKTDVKKDDVGLFTDGEKNRSDLPAVFGLGAAYTLIPELKLEADFTYYFQKQADWGKDSSGKDYAEQAGDCFGAGIAAIYRATQMVTASAGVCYTGFLWDNEDAYYNKFGSYETLYSNNVAILVGAAIEPVQGIKLNIGYNYTWWKSETLKYNNNGLPEISVKTKNATHVISVGADCSF